jgi:ABC-type bacteriocin/lantibiotic exporter with double-glycine peptidase domain
MTLAQAATLLCTFTAIVQGADPPPSQDNCACAAVVCAYAARLCGVPLPDSEAAAHGSSGSGEITLEGLAVTLRSAGIRAEIKRLSPEELLAQRMPAILVSLGANGHRHFETFVGADARRVALAGALDAHSVSVRWRDWDGYARRWDGRALLFQPAAPSFARGIGVGLTTLSAPFALGWLVAGRLRKKREIPAPCLGG